MSVICLSSLHNLFFSCSDDRRIGKNGSDDIKTHPFFANIDFNSALRTKDAPYKPTIKYKTDTSNFDPIDPDKLKPDDESQGDEDINRDYHGFYEFTFRRFFDDGHPGNPIHPLRLYFLSPFS